MLHRILPVKYYLKKISVLPSDSCTFCDKEVETIQHVFIGCENVSSIWSSLSMHIYNTTSQRICFNVDNILLGELPSSKGNKIINLIILYTKQYIFSCLKKGKLPNFLELLFFLFNKYKVEKCIAHQNLEIVKFNNTWHVWKRMFDNMQDSWLLHLLLLIKVSTYQQNVRDVWMWVWKYCKREAYM